MDLLNLSTRRRVPSAFVPVAFLALYELPEMPCPALSRPRMYTRAPFRCQVGCSVEVSREVAESSNKRTESAVMQDRPLAIVFVIKHIPASFFSQSRPT